jgi:hypothetical protein
LLLHRHHEICRSCSAGLDPDHYGLSLFEAGIAGGNGVGGWRDASEDIRAVSLRFRDDLLLIFAGQRYLCAGDEPCPLRSPERWRLKRCAGAGPMWIRGRPVGAQPAHT